MGGGKGANFCQTIFTVLLTFYPHPYVHKFPPVDNLLIMRSPSARFRYYIMWITCEPITSIMLNRKIAIQYQCITYICI